MKPVLSQVCSLHSTFADDVEHYAAGRCNAIEVWLTKLEEYLKSHSIDDVKLLLEEYGVALPVASFQGGLFTSDAAAGKETWRHFNERLAICRQLSIPTMVIAVDIFGKPSAASIEALRSELARAGDRAAPHGVRVALEFQAKSLFANNLETAATLVEECSHEYVGLCLDTFHFWTGPSRLSDLAYLSAKNLFHVQVSDLAGVPRELATDADRILPGEGDLPLDVIIERLRSINYEGYVSIELMNPQIWQVPPRQFGEIAMTAARRLLGQAEMSEGESLVS